jgi:hypothetical protein
MKQKKMKQSLYLRFSVRTQKNKGSNTQSVSSPFFVIPECNITLDNVLAMYSKNRNGKIDYDQAAYQLGSYDNRTIKKHYERIEKIIETTTTRLAEYLSGIGSFSSLPPSELAYNKYEVLKQYLRMFNEAGTKMRGKAEKIEPIVILSKTYFEEKARKPIFRPLSFVSYLLYFHDTS